MSVFVIEKLVVTFFVVLINIAKRTHVVIFLKIKKYIVFRHHVFFASDYIIETQTFVVTSIFEIKFSNSNALFDNLFRVCFFIFSIEQTWFFFFVIILIRNVFKFLIWFVIDEICVWSYEKKIVEIVIIVFFLKQELKKRKNTIRETRKSSNFLTKTYNNKFKKSKIVKNRNVDWKNSLIVFEF